MTIALATLVLCSLSPPSLVSAASLAQGKVQIIKGKRGTGKLVASPEPGAQVSPSTDANAAKAQDLDRKSAELDAKNKDLAQREQAMQEKETASAEADKKKAEQLKTRQKHLEKVGQQNEQLMQQATDSLAGD